MEKNAEHLNLPMEEFSELVDIYLKEKDVFNVESSYTERLG